MQVGRNYYAVLGISSLADERAIRSAYLALIARYHPDVNPSAAAAQRAAEITEAFSVLSKASSRSAYDASLSPASGPDSLSDRPRSRAGDGGPRSSRSSASQAAQAAASEKSLFRTPPPRWPKPDSQKFLDQLSARWRALKGAIIAERATWRVIGRSVGALLLFVFLVWLLRAGLLLTFERNSSAPLAASQQAAHAPSAIPPSPPAVAKLSRVPEHPAEAKPSSPQIPAGPAPGLRADSVGNALNLFATVLYSSGMDGAIQHSRSCHNEAMAAKDWKKMDFCNAFDDAGLYLDARVRSRITTAKLDADPSYFELTANKSTQTAAYMMLSNASSGFADRVDHIQKLVEPSVQSIIENHFFGAPPQAASAAAPGTPSPGSGSGQAAARGGAPH